MVLRRNKQSKEIMKIKGIIFCKDMIQHVMMDPFPITNIINSFYLLRDMQSDCYAHFASFDAQVWLVLNENFTSENLG